MTVIAALINAEPAASRQPVSRRPDVDVASLSSPDSKLRAGGGRNAKKENQKLRHGGKSAMSLRGRGDIYIYRVAIREIKVPPSEANGKPPPFLLHPLVPSHPSSPSFICGGINKNLRAIYGGSSARSGGSINLLRSARLARRLQNRRPSSLYEARID